MLRSTVSRALLGVVLVAAALFVVVVGIDVPGWKREVEALSSAIGGVSLTSDSLRFLPSRGLVAEGVEARAEVGGDSFVARAPRMILALRPGPLLRGELVVGSILLEEPSIEILSRTPALRSGATGTDDEAPESRSGHGRDSRRLRFDLDSFRLAGGRVLGRMEGGGGTTTLEGLDLELWRPRLAGPPGEGLAGLEARGRLRAAELALEGLELPDVAADLEVERGRFRLGSFEVWSESGHYAVDRLDVDLAQSPYRYRLAMRALDVDAGELWGLGPGLGPLRATIQASGEGSGLSGVVAEMTVDLDAGELPAAELLTRLDAALGTAFVGAAYEPSTAEVSLSGSELSIEPCDLDTSRGHLVVGGTAGVDGALALTLDVVVEPEVLAGAGLSAEILDALGERGGWVRLPLAVGGRLERPRLVPSEAGLERLLTRRGGAARELVARVRSGLERLLAAARG